MIPRILHTIWIPRSADDQPSAFLRACTSHTVAVHSHWEHLHHSTAAILADDAFDPIRDGLDDCWQRFAGRPTSQSDLMRLAALYLYGGVYVDADVFALKPFDGLLDRDLLLAADRMEPLLIGEHVMGAVPRHPVIWGMLNRFIHAKPNEHGRYSPGLTRWVIESGMTGRPLSAMVPAVLCPVGRIVESEGEAYQVDDRAYCLHCWSRYPDGQDVAYDIDTLKAMSDPAESERSPGKTIRHRHRWRLVDALPHDRVRRERQGSVGEPDVGEAGGVTTGSRTCGRTHR
nr:glycosyltransferase [uncultured Rhodopila sp.]